MHALTSLQSTVADLQPIQGLAVEEVLSRARLHVSLEDAGRRGLAFYLTEIDIRKLYLSLGFRSTVALAESRLDLDARRTRELVAVGRKLLTVPRIDAALCAQRISWSKAVRLLRVVTPEVEAKWLRIAERSTVRKLERLVRCHKLGESPRESGNRKGLAQIRFPVRTSVTTLTHRKLDLAKQKLSDELGHAVDDAELLDVMAELFLNLQPDGTVPGHKRVDLSLYRIVLHAGRDEETDDAEGLQVDSELGLLPLETDTTCACDAPDEHGLAPKTPTAMRRQVLLRDGYRCRCCGSLHRVQAHHIHFRADGGPTCPDNLISICVLCHALVHETLLVLDGTDAGHVVFRDALGRALHEAGAYVPKEELLAMSAPQQTAASAAPAEPPPETVTFDALPRTIDGEWWRRHAPLLRLRSGGGLEFRPGSPLPRGEATASADKASPKIDFETAFGDLVGQTDRLRRLRRTAMGSQKRGEPFPHTLLVGPPGTGKTTLARCLAAACDARLERTSGPLLQDVEALLRLLAALQSGDVLFVDEIHAVPQPVLEALYEAMAERRVSLVIHAGVRSQTVSLALPAFTLLAATTEEGRLHDALRNRFGLRESLGYYTPTDLADLVVAAARTQGFVLTRGGAKRLAAFARGTPREALRLLARVLDDAASGGGRSADDHAVQDALDRLGYDRNGLEPAERRYLELLESSTVPIPLARLARMLGESIETVTRYVEPFLFRLGWVRTTARGRVATRSPRLLEA